MNKILEKFWWAAAVLTFFAVVYFTYLQGFNKWKFYFLVPSLSIGMALMRRFMNNKLEKGQQQKNKKK
jgi:dipeptide/tripeptide permease